ncbi:unnamed protein product [Allacma fusca]|uniref:Uncharacterized protein n=1 Tax=Allacma fusca TaxID=39272 RepID=A0A8J2NR75_9HEXA|nr:unnamed protein product [Allacma fusca]
MKIFLIFVLVLAAVWVNSASPVAGKERAVDAREVKITEDVKRHVDNRDVKEVDKRGAKKIDLRSRETRSWWNPFTWFGSGDSKEAEAPAAAAAPK